MKDRRGEMEVKGSVLIVDDDAALLDIFRKGLLSEDYRCETAVTAASALEVVEKNPFDVMVTDIVLPDMNGFRLTEQVKRLRPDMAVIIMTGFIDDFSYDDAVEAGASDFIKKPFTLKEIRARIEYAKKHEKMHTLLLTDELTGLYNRRGFFALSEYQLKIAKRQMSGIYMLYADLDDLKGINDNRGHPEGDLALIDIAGILRNNFRESDVIARIGGDEFVVIPVGNAGDNVEGIIGRLQKAIDLHNAGSNHGYKLSMSAGAAFYDPANPCSIEELLARGDKSMYERKKNRQLDQFRLLS
jgi:two-component system cell cycle response regulator